MQPCHNHVCAPKIREKMFLDLKRKFLEDVLFGELTLSIYYNFHAKLRRPGMINKFFEADLIVYCFKQKEADSNFTFCLA